MTTCFIPDSEASTILRTVGEAKHFNRWMLAQFRPYLGARVIDAGCGIGSFAEQLLDRTRLVCVDHDAGYIEQLAQRFRNVAQVKVLRMDLTDSAQYAALVVEKSDTILCLNVLEHLEQDTAALANFYRTLVPGGHAAILVPAHPRLYGPCDRALGHCRRYTAGELQRKMTEAGFEMVCLRQFNRLGALGWLVNKWLGRSGVEAGQMRLFERVVGIAKVWDWLRVGPGLSLIAVGRKSANARETTRR